MKKLLLIICSFFSIIIASAQTINFQWAKQMGGAGVSGGRSVAVDLSGNVYTTGSFSGTNDFNPGLGVFNLTSFGSSDIFVSKIDALGNFIWAKQMGGISGDVGYAVAVDLSGNVYTTGYFNASADFDPGAGTNNLISFGSSDIFVSKLDAAGNFVWVKQMGGTGIDAANSIALDASGEPHVTGYFNGTADFNPGSPSFNLTSSGVEDIFISKLDALGNFVWAKQMGGNQTDNGYSVTVDLSGNVYCTGFFKSSAGFGGTYLATNGVEDIFITKLDITGNFMWTQQIGGNGPDVGNGIAVSNAGNVYTIGIFQNAADFDPSTGGTFPLNSNGLQDVFVSKLDGLGNFIWAKQIGGTANEDASSIALDPAGSVYLLGNFFSTVDFDPNAGTYNLTTLGPQDIFAAKLNSSGNFAWAMQLGGLGADFGFSITIDTLCNVYTTGYFNSTVDFDPTAGVFNMTSAGLDDIYIQKIGQSQCCLPPPSPVNTSTNTSICSGGTATLTATGTGTITWYQTATGTTTLNIGSTYITPTLSPGTYTFYTESSIACAVSNTRTAVTVTVNTTPTTSVSASTSTICSGNTTTLTALGALTYSWIPTSTLNSSTASSVIANPNTTTVYTVTGANGVCTSTKQLTITVNQTPTLTVSSSSPIICNDSTSVLNVSGATNYSWSPTTNLSASSGATVNASPNSSTTYTVIGYNGNCSTTQTINVLVSPSINLTTSDLIIGQGSSTNLFASGGVTYTWTSENTLPCIHCPSITVSPSVTSTYCVESINSDGCFSSQCLTIEVDMLCGDAFVPNAFSPNGDGHNDLLNVRINPNCVVRFNMRIFNRWGEKVFESDELTNSWNGVFRGEDLNPAVFVYYLKIVTISSANDITKKGNVTLIR